MLALSGDVTHCFRLHAIKLFSIIIIITCSDIRNYIIFVTDVMGTIKLTLISKREPIFEFQC